MIGFLGPIAGAVNRILRRGRPGKPTANLRLSKAFFGPLIAQIRVRDYRVTEV
jgi:hypothetical protein